MMIEDLSVDDDDDYQIFIQRKDTIKKNLTAMAAVTYDEKPNQRQEASAHDIGDGQEDPRTTSDDTT